MMRFATILLSAVVGLSAETAASAQRYPSSGTLLGVYAFPTSSGMRVSGTLPGYSAHGRLRSGDVLRRVGTMTGDVYSVYTFSELERAKTLIGPNVWASLEVWRPQTGLIYFWVEFRPIRTGLGTTRTQVRMLTEREKPGAAAVFDKTKKKVWPQPQPSPFPLPWPQPLPGPIGPGTESRFPMPIGPGTESPFPMPIGPGAESPFPTPIGPGTEAPGSIGTVSPSSRGR